MNLLKQHKEKVKKMIEDNNVLSKYIESKRIIRKAMEEHQLVLFVGAGASIASGMPTWGQAIKIIADRLSINTEQLDFLRTPQYYYNARGKKEYIQLMRSIFRHSDHLVKHAIHDKIIEFNTDTIITTNYDHLIEQAAEDNSEIRMVVSKDADLPYRRGGKELIKMHGDFENDNFVLKEDDFLAYSRNFKLIENYVKSLIGTKVVLFIGYSFNDPDLKLIFSWVKDILGGDFQRAYLIEAGKAYDVNEAEYFRNFGINLLYASIQLQDRFKSNDLTNNLLLMLDWLLSVEKKDKLTALYEELKHFTSMNYVSQNYIRNALFNAGIGSDNGVLTVQDTLRLSDEETLYIFKALAYEIWTRSEKNIVLSDLLINQIYNACDDETERQNRINENNHRLELYFKDFNPDSTKQKLVKEIYDILCHSNLKFMQLHLPNGENSYNWLIAIIPLEHYFTLDWMEDVDTFNYAALNKLAEKNNAHLTETKPELYLEQGYILFILGDYFTAYNCYKNAKSIYYRRREFVNFFIAEFNRYILAKMITHANGIFLGIDREDVALVKEELNTIDLDRVFDSLPDLGKTNKALKDLYTFNLVYTLFQDAYKLSEKVSEQAKAHYSVFIGTAAFSGMRERVLDYYKYISNNLLPVNNYSEHMSVFRIYFQSIVNSVITSDDEDEISLVQNVRSIHAKELVPFDILVALKFIELKDLEKLLKDIPFNLPLSGEALDYLNTVISYCTQGNLSSTLFWKCLLILGHSNLTESIIETSLSILSKIILPIDYREHSACIVKLIISSHKQGCLKSDALRLIEIILFGELNYIVDNMTEANYLHNTVLTLLWILKENGCAFNDNKTIQSLISKESRLLCVSMYPLLGKKAQKPIFNAYHDWQFESTYLGFEFYYALLDAKVISPDANAEKQILEYYSHKKVDIGSSEIEFVKILPMQNEDNFIYNLLDLYLKGLIIDKESFRKLIEDKNIPGASWMMDWKKYNYESFNTDWLLLCSKKLINDICGDDSIREIIRRLIETEYKNGKANKKILDLYFTYFIQ